MDYALNRDKTEQDLLESALGCTCENAFEDMCRVKEMWHKEQGVQGFHLVQSFAAGEVTPELAHQIGLGFAERLLGGQFQAVVSTHLNTGHIHNHLVWNSVSLKDGRKYRSNHRSYITQVRRISDELCKQHGISIISTERSERAARPYAQWLAEQKGTATWKTPIQQDVDAAIASALTWKQFLRTLEQQGYRSVVPKFAGYTSSGIACFYEYIQRQKRDDVSNSGDINGKIYATEIILRVSFATFIKSGGTVHLLIFQEQKELC